MNELALFAGAGGGILGGILLGWKTVCAVELDSYARDVLVSRQNDGCLAPFPIWDDIRTFDGRPWNGIVDVVSGGFPCQDISVAGAGKGITGERSGLWKEMARIVDEVRPQFVFVENSPALTSRGLGTVLGDLAELGYNAKWGMLGAEDAIWNSCDPIIDHQRYRIFVLASSDSNSLRKLQSERSIKDIWQRFVYSNENITDIQSFNTMLDRCKQMEPAISQREERQTATSETEHADFTTRRGWWSSEPELGRVAHGVANRVDRLRCIGNGQVPSVVEIAWKTLTQ